MAKTKEWYVAAIPRTDAKLIYVQARNNNGACEEAFKQLGGKAFVLNQDNLDQSLMKISGLAVQYGLSLNEVEMAIKEYRRKRRS